MYTFLLFLFCLPALLEKFSITADITNTKFLKDPDTLVSNNTKFKLGFFSPKNSFNRYVGIWYNIPNSDKLEVIWVANRDNPLTDSSGQFKISQDGNLRLLNAQNKTFWLSSIPVSEGNNPNPIARLLDTGSLELVSNAGNGSTIWASFNHPTDCLVPPVDFTIRKDLNDAPVFRSWRSEWDPSTGNFSVTVNIRSVVEIFIWNNEKPYWRSGPWNANTLLGIAPFMSLITLNGFRSLENNIDTFKMSFALPNATLLEHVNINYDGNMVFKQINDRGKWLIAWQSRLSDCDVFGKCGPFGICNPRKSPICECLRGFLPANKKEWRDGNWTNGCVRQKTLECEMGGSKDGFLELKLMKVPDNAQLSTVDDLVGCRSKCLEMCSCLAYASYSGIGCMIWKECLIDIQQYNISGVDLFIRLANSELPRPDPPPATSDRRNSKKTKIIVAVMVIIGATIITAILYCLWRWKGKRRDKKITTNKKILFHDIIEASGNGDEFQECTLFEFENLVIATNNFDVKNKLGQGGFGPVYKGKFENGQEIAVKRLSRASGQGQQEFVNEVIVISKLQHKNLVKLLGCCVEGEEKLLVYEFLPNKSLDALLFDPLPRENLDWKTRFEIIKGICRGVLYLQRDSRLKIIHRDLKASNVLLDEELNPKISDFGMARIFGGKQDQATTLRVVGTYGYMAPEYAMEGRFSDKSDVYSLGVLVLEIVSGRRNGATRDGSLRLLCHAWNLWNEDNIVSLIDPTISNTSYREEILRCIHVGFLCVEEFPEDRPTISTMITMLDSDYMLQLPNPKRPGFTQNRNGTVQVLQDDQIANLSLNLVSLSDVAGR